jgi:hypothetical protein
VICADDGLGWDLSFAPIVRSRRRILNERRGKKFMKALVTGVAGFIRISQDRVLLAGKKVG